MIGTGGHVREDIPEGIEGGRELAGSGSVSYARHLGSDPLLRAAARERIAAALGEWTPGQTSVVFLGRGCSVPEANADHVRLGRLLREEGGYGDVVTGFIQIAEPDLTTALDRAYAHGGRKIVIMPHYLFPGLLQNWARQQSAAWAADHPDAEVRLADVIGDCDELAQTVADRYRSAAQGWIGPASGPAPQVYLSGLVLTGRTVLVAGAGTVATRRVGKLLKAGADVQVVAPQASEKIQQAGGRGTAELDSAGRLRGRSGGCLVCAGADRFTPGQCAGGGVGRAAAGLLRPRRCCDRRHGLDAGDRRGRRPVGRGGR